MPSVDYVVVVNLLPQDATKTEKAFVLDVAHESRQTILQSADDAQRLVKPGKPGSKVVVWDAERWPGDIVAYRCAGRVEAAASCYAAVTASAAEHDHLGLAHAVRRAVSGF